MTDRLYSVQVYGASDDLIEVEGDISEEFSHYDDECYLAFSNGAALKMTYNGDWHIKQIAGDPEQVLITHATGEEYTDTATILFGEQKPWVVYGTRFERLS